MLPNYAQQYETLWKRHWWWQARRRLVAGYVGRLARQRKLGEILDIGCGNGLFFDDLARYGQVHGIEPDAALVPSDSVHRSRIEITPFSADYVSPQRYDLVLMLDVLEHIPADGPALRRAWELLNPGGFLLLTVPALMVLWSAHDVVNQHHRRYSKGGLRKLLEEAGFEVRTLRFCFGWAVAPLLLRRVLHSAQPAAGQDYQVHVPPTPVNALFYTLTSAEQAICTLAGPPVGSSLLAIAQKP